MTKNTTWNHAAVCHDERLNQKGHRACLLWYTGLSGSGKSTIANAVDRRLFDMGFHTYLLDGDNLRQGLNRDLEFGEADRIENIRRTTEVARLFVDAGLIVGAALISPFRVYRTQARELAGRHFVEIFVDTPLSICEQRDPKGLYKKARSGEISDFTGIDSPYEAPEHPDIHLKASECSIDACVEQVIAYLMQRRIVASLEY